MSDASSNALPYGVRLIGWSGVIPFVAFLVVALAEPSRQGVALSMFIGYGALILSFIGGTRWGSGLTTFVHPSRFVEAVLPCLMGFAALLLFHTPGPALLVLAAGYSIWLVIDRRDRLWPPGYWRMRTRISVTVLLLHAAWIPLMWLR